MADESGVRNEAHGVLHGVVVQAQSIHQLSVVQSPASPVTAPSRVGELLGVAAGRTRQLLHTLPALRGDVAIDQLTEDVRELAVALPRLSPGLVAEQLVRAQDTAWSLLQRRHRRARRQQLYFITGIVSAMLARVAHECGDLPAARLHAHAAFECARRAGHDGLRARVRALQSAVAYWSDQPLDALRHARSGAVFAARANSTMAARLPVSEARAWAALGNGREALSAIARAERAWDRVRPDDLDEFGGVCTFTWPRHLHFAANALTWLPEETTLAERYAAEAVKAYRHHHAQEWAFGAQAGAHTDLAVCYLRRSEREGAAEALAPVLAMPTELRISSIILSIRRVRSSLLRSSAAGNHEFQDRLNAFADTPLDALMS